MTDGHVGISVRGRVVIAALEGELDISNVAEIGGEIRGAVGNDHAGLCLDLSEVRYVDSAGVRMVFELISQLETCRQGLALVVPDEAPVRRLIDVTNLASTVPVCPSVDECVAALDGSVEDLL